MARVLSIVMRMTTSDEALARSAAEGDLDAFSALLGRHYDGLFRLGFRLTGNKAEAEDLTQDICAALPAKLRAYRSEAKFTTWLYRVAVNASHDRRRRVKTHMNAANGWGDWEVNRQAVNEEAAAKVDWLSQAMNALSDDLRDTLALLLDDEMTHAQAGDILNISEGTVSWRVSEAKKQLRELAQNEEMK